MRKFFKRLAVPALALSAMWLGPSLYADTVSYHTVLFFTSAGSGAQLTGTPVTGINPPANTGTDTLSSISLPTYSVTAAGETFNGANAVSLNPNGTPSGTGFGTFSFTGNGSPLTGSLELDIYQDATSPTSGSDAGSGVLVGSATATFQLDPSKDTISVQFQGATFNPADGLQELSLFLPAPGNTGFPPTVLYTLSNQLVRNSAGGFEIEGEVAEAPLPSTASLGLTMLAACGIVGAAMKLRRQNDEVAA